MMLALASSLFEISFSQLVLLLLLCMSIWWWRYRNIACPTPSGPAESGGLTRSRAGPTTSGPAESGGLTRRRAECRVDDPQEIRIVLFGKTGSGKSATGNTILGVSDPETQDDIGFKVFSGQASGTVECKVNSVSINGRTVRVVDTPGIFDTYQNALEVLFEVTRCLLLTCPGPHILLFVMSCSARFTKEEYEAYKQLCALFDPSLNRYICFAFTRCEDLPHGRTSMEENLTRSKDLFEKTKANTKSKADRRDLHDINEILKECGGRYLLFNNKGDLKTKDEQVQELLNMISNLGRVNPSPYFQDNITMMATKEKEARLQEIMAERNITDKTEAWKILENWIKEEKCCLIRGIIYAVATALYGGVGVVGSVLTFFTGGLAAPIAVAGYFGAATTSVMAKDSLVKARCNIM